MYRTIGTEIWTDPKFRGLPAPGKLLFIYLFTNPHAHVGGLYYIPDTFILHETGMKQEALDALWDTLSGVGLVWRDKEKELVWVKNMLKRQGKGEKIMRSVAAHLKTLHNCSVISDFLQKYPHVKLFYRDRVSKGYPKLDKSGIQEQEQDKKNTTYSSAAGAADEVLPEALNNPDFIAAWAEWKKHRREIRHKLTPTTAKKQISEFAAMGVKRAVAAIEYTITKGWQGIQEPPASSNGQHQPDKPSKPLERAVKYD